MHWLVQQNTPDLNREEWERRGAQILSSVPSNGYIIAAPDGMNWEGLDLAYYAPLDAFDKLSPSLNFSPLLAADTSLASSRQWVIIHFHSDVQGWEIDGILDAEGVLGTSNASLAANDRLANLTREQWEALSLWDEAEFIYPAPESMPGGNTLLHCAGVLSSGYEVAMLAATYGDGWDGPGRGQASITYSFGKLSSHADASQTKVEFRRALDEWSRVAAVRFTESSLRTAARNLDLSFVTGDHGDPYPFLNGTTVLAHSYYPAPPNPEPVAGDIHMNDAWTWSVGGQWDLYSVLLHELGHALGIGHTDDPNSVMYPYYQKASGLKAPDIDSILQIYASPASSAPTPLVLSILNPVEGTKLSATTVNVSGSASGSGAGLQVEYRNESNAATARCLVNSTGSTWSCAAVPLSGGANQISIQGSFAGNTVVLNRSLTRETEGDVNLSISSPTGSTPTTTAAQITVSGTAAHSTGISSVKWSSNRSKSGVAMGLETWSATVPLESGSNEISVVATARSGIATTKKITVERTVPATTPANPGSNPGEDKTPPQMTIQQPIGNYIITSATKLTFKGTATDNVGVQKVTWTNSAGDQSGAAISNVSNGATNWLFDVSIAIGFNTIQVRAWDAAGNSTLYSATVRRY